jgi:hypothetical protein
LFRFSLWGVFLLRSSPLRSIPGLFNDTMYRMQEVHSSECKLFGQTAVLCHTAIHSNLSRFTLFLPGSEFSREHLPLGLENSKDAFPGVSVPWPQVAVHEKWRTLCIIITQLVVQQGVVGIESLSVLCPHVTRFQSNTNVFVTITMYQNFWCTSQISLMSFVRCVWSRSKRSHRPVTWRSKHAVVIPIPFGIGAGFAISAWLHVWFSYHSGIFPKSMMLQVVQSQWGR